MKNIEAIFKSIEGVGCPPLMRRKAIETEGARDLLAAYLQFTLEKQGSAMEWLPEYEAVAKWIGNTEGKGITMSGTYGRGKSVIAAYVIPAIFNAKHRLVVNVYSAVEMNAKMDEIKNRAYVVLDDIGTEMPSNNYGSKVDPLAEILDNAEKKAKTVIVTTNLNRAQLTARYGERVVDRLLGLTKVVVFRGDSLRK
ncbi:MAG: hypothetical protein ACRCZM_11820 [Bacteroidales bacterium]